MVDYRLRRAAAAADRMVGLHAARAPVNSLIGAMPRHIRIAAVRPDCWLSIHLMLHCGDDEVGFESADSTQVGLSQQGL